MMNVSEQIYVHPDRHTYYKDESGKEYKEVKETHYLSYSTTLGELIESLEEHQANLGKNARVTTTQESDYSGDYTILEITGYVPLSEADISHRKYLRSRQRDNAREEAKKQLKTIREKYPDLEGTPREPKHQGKVVKKSLVKPLPAELENLLHEGLLHEEF